MQIKRKRRCEEATRGRDIGGEHVRHGLKELQKMVSKSVSSPPRITNAKAWRARIRTRTPHYIAFPTKLQQCSTCGTIIRTTAAHAQ